VTSEAPAAFGSASAAGIVPAAFRWMRPLAIAAIAVVVIGAFQTEPGPGAGGEHLGVSLALIVFTVGTLAFAILPSSESRALFPLLVAVVLAAAALVGLQPNGPGFLGVFPAVAAAALLLAPRPAGVVASLAVMALAAAWALGGGHRPVIGIVLNEFGVVAFFLLAVFARRYREANERAHWLILELNETRAAQAQAAALAERQRLAREMHDVLAHSLSGLVLNLEGARLMAERGRSDPEMTHVIGRAQQLAKTGLEEARRAIGMLRGDALPGPEGVAELAAEFERDTGVPCCFVSVGEHRELGSDSRLTIYRVAQEALTNIRRHARPDRVELRLVSEPTGTQLTVNDHRAGGERPLLGDSGGYGLTGMRERAELIGGTLVAEPTADGFRVALWIPS
jgi:signal transduction histidine kinase